MKTKETILIYVRPWSVDYFRALARASFSNCDVVYISDFRLDGVVSTHKVFYASLAIGTKSNLTQDLVDGVIFRCRLLRRLTQKKSEDFVHAMSNSIQNVIETYKPSLVLGLSVDSYVADVIYETAKFFNIPFYGMVPICIPGYHLVSARGELTCFRKPLDCEIGKVYNDMIKNDFKASYLGNYAKSKLKILHRLAREVPKPIYFFSKKWASRDHFNYHYLVASDRFSSIFDFAWIVRSNYSDFDWKTKLMSLKGRIKIYFPLQYFPENNSDYWPPKSDLMHYEQGVLNILPRFDDRFVVLVKEHPNMLGFRTKSFYNRLRSIKSNLVFVDPGAPSVDLIALSDATMTWNSSAGIEAAIRGKPVICFGSPYYALADASIFLSFSSVAEFGNGDSTARFIQGFEVSSLEKIYRFLGVVLGACLPGEMQEVWFNNASLAQKNQADLAFKSIGANWARWREFSTGRTI